MLFGCGQFKTAVYIIFLALCLGQEQFRLCERNNEANGERSSSDPNDLRECHRIRYENFEREKLTRHMNQDFNRVDDHRVDREQLSKQTSGEEPKRVERQSRGDVTRHLNEKNDEQRKCLRRLSVRNEISHSDIKRNQQESSRQFNEYNDNNQERHETLTRLNNRDVDRRSEDNRDERYENLRQLDRKSQSFDERLTPLRSENDAIIRSDVARSLRDDEQDFQAQRRFENEEKREEHRQISRRLVEPEQQREISRHLEFDQKIRSETLKRSDDYTEQSKIHRRREHELEPRHEENKQEKSVSRRLSDNIRNDREAEADLRTTFKREVRVVSKRSGKGRESAINEFSNLANDREIQRNNIRSLDDNREDTSRQFNNRKTQQVISIRSENEARREVQSGINRRPEGNLETRQNILRRENDNKSERDTSIRSEIALASVSLTAYESIGRKLHNREVQRQVSRQSEDNRNEYHPTFERFDEREAQHLLNRASPKVRNSIHRNEQEHKKRLDDREIPNDLRARSVITRETRREIELSPRREHELKEHRENRIERRFEERNIQSDGSSRLVVKREELHNTMRRFNDREDKQETFRHLNSREAQLEVSRRSAEDGNSRRLEVRLPVRERKNIQQREEISEHEDRYNRKDQRDITRRLDGAPEEYYQKMVQLREREVRQWLDDGRETQRINGKIYHRERRSIQRQDVNKEEHKEIPGRLDDRDIRSRLEGLAENKVNLRVVAKQKSPLSNLHLSQMERENQQREFVQFNAKPTFTRKQRNSNANYILVGQGVILAYVIMKTLYGKNNFKNQLFRKLQDGLEIIGVF